MYETLVPTHWVPHGDLTLSNVTLQEERPSEIHHLNDMYISRVLKISGPAPIVGEWMYFHSLISNSIEPIYYHENVPEYNIVELQDGDGRIPSESTREDFNNIIPKVYEIAPSSISMTYADAYARFQNAPGSIHNAIKAYFLAESIMSNTAKIRTISVAYWQVTMYVSVIETLLGDPPKCSGTPTCEVCGNNFSNHHTIGTAAWIKRELYDRISGVNNRKEYKKVLEVARYAIRHKSIHEGLMSHASVPTFPSGTYTYDMRRAVSSYETDLHAETALLKGLRELTRFLLLNKIFGIEIYPALRGFDTHHINVTLSASDFE